MALEKIKPRVVDATGNYAFNDVTLTGNVSSPTANIGNLIGVNNLTASSTTITVIGSLSTTANITAGNIKTDNLLYANGAAYSIGSGATVAGSNTQIQFNDSSSFGASANLTFDKTSNTLTVAKISGNGALLTSLTGANVTGTVGNATYATSAGTATSATTSDTVTTAAQPNITSVGTLSSLSVTGNITSGNANLGNLATANFFTGNGSLLTSIIGANVTGNVGNALNAYAVAGANVSGAVTYAATANAVAGANVMGQVGNALVAGTVYTNAQPNITSVGTLTSLIVGNATANSIFGNGTITATGNITANNLITSGSGGNISGANYVIANYFSGSGNNLSNIQGANVSGQVGNALVAGTVYTASQPNITSVGTLAGITATGVLNFTGASNVSLGPVANVRVTGGSSGQYLQTDGTGNLSWTTVTVSTASISNGNSNVNIPSANGNVNISAVGNANILVVTGTGVNVSGTLNATGNLTAGNIITSGSGGNISGANNISANTFTGNGSLLTSLIGGNVTGQVGNALVAGTVYTNAQPNITSVGTLSSLSVTGDISGANLTLSGNLMVSGTTTTVNSTTTRVVDPIIEQGGGANGAALSSNDNKDRGTLLHYYTGSTATDAFVGWDNSNAEFAFGSNVSVSSDVVTFNSLGNVRASYFLGNGSQLTSVTATTTGTVTTAAQPNITSVGTLSSLTATGNVTGGNLVTAGKVYSSDFINGGTGIYLAAGPSGYINFFTTGGDKASISDTGNIIASNLIANSTVFATTANISGNVNAGNVSATTFTGALTGAATSATTAGTVTTAAQPNITSVGTLTSLGVTGNITSGNANLGNAAVANFFVGNGSTLTALTFGNITTFTTAGLTTDELYLQGTTRLNVTASGSSGYLFDQYGVTVNPAIYVTSGQTLAFNLDVSGHPFLIQTSGGANYSVGLVHVNTTGTVSSTSSAQGQIAGTLYWKIPYGITGNYKYQCSIHGGMNGNIVVTDANIANVQVGNASASGTVTTAAQPNITSVGTLTSLDVTGNITSGNANLGNNVTANFFTGSGAYLTSVTAVTAATVTTNAQPNITSVGTLTTLTVGNATANSTFGNGTITTNGNINFTGANVSLGAVGNIKITGGTAGYFITTDGAGNLSWGAAAGGGGVSATGSNTQIQFNDGGVLGATSNLVFDKTTNTFTTGRVVASVGANLGSNISNIYMGGGGVSQILATDGSGNLTWVAQPTAVITVDNFTGNGVQTAFTLSTTPSSINQTIVNYNGAFQLRTSAYTLSGPTLTFTEAPVNGSLIEVTTTMGATSGAGAFVTRTYTGNGVATTYTVTSGVTVSSVLVTENGLVQTPTVDYTITSTTLTFVVAPANSVVIQIRELAMAIATTVSPAYRAYTGNGVATTYAVTSGLTANSLIVAENGIIQRPTTDYTVSGSTLTFVTAPNNGVDIQIRELSLNGGMSTGGTSLPYQGGNSGKYLTTDGATSSWANVSALPTQSGNSGKYLTTDGTTSSWANVTSGVTLGKTVALNMFLGI